MGPACPASTSLQIEKHVQQGVKRLRLQDSAQKMGGVVDILGARVTPDGKVPLLETRHCFYSTAHMTKVSGGQNGAMCGALHDMGVTVCQAFLCHA